MSFRDGMALLALQNDLYLSRLGPFDSQLGSQGRLVGKACRPL
jgi:hypothetical protein